MYYIIHTMTVNLKDNSSKQNQMDISKTFWGIKEKLYRIISMVDEIIAYGRQANL